VGRLRASAHFGGISLLQRAQAAGTELGSVVSLRESSVLVAPVGSYSSSDGAPHACEAEQCSGVQTSLHVLPGRHACVPHAFMCAAVPHTRGHRVHLPCHQRHACEPVGGFPMHNLSLALTALHAADMCASPAAKPNLGAQPPGGFTCVTLRRWPGGRRPRPGGEHRRAGGDGVHLCRVRAQGAADGVRSGSDWRLSACSDSLAWPSALRVTLLILLHRDPARKESRLQASWARKKC